MKIQGQIEPLEGLAALDAELKDSNEQLSRERESLDKKKQTSSELEAKLARDRQSIAEMEKLRNELMQELRQMSNQIEKSREKLARCRTEREANAAQREVEELRKLYRDREIEVEKLNALLDSGRGEVDNDREGARRASWASSARQRATPTRLLGEVGAKARGQGDVAQGVVAQVSAATLPALRAGPQAQGHARSRYTHDGTCSECHMRMPPMLFQQLLRSEDFEQCPSCAPHPLLSRPLSRPPVARPELGGAGRADLDRGSATR